MLIQPMTMPTATSLLLLAMTVAPLVCGRNLYVKHRGEDQKTCGTSVDSPCKTIRYTIAQVSQSNDVIHVDPSKGSYVNESAGEYLTVNHPLLIMGQNHTIYGPATILCQQPGAHKLFNVSGTGNQTDTGHSHTVTVTLSNIKIQGCKPNSDGIGQGVMTVHNGIIKMDNCHFVNNGIILHHTQDMGNQCDRAKVYATNCSFSSNQISKPYQPGITLIGCKTLDLTLKNVIFKTTALKLQSTHTLKLSFFNVSIDGKNLRGTSLSITLANSTDISLTNCTIQNHLASKESAVSVATNSPSSVPPNIHLKNVLLLNNQGQKTLGGALAVFARFMKDRPFPMNIQLQGCQFINNSATDNGGAIYLRGVDGVKVNQCLFLNNTGLNGGAVHADKVANFALSNSIFMHNTAKDEGDVITRAGALYNSDSDIHISNCTFKNNRASYTPNTLYIQNASYVSIQQSQFESPSGIYDQPESNILLIDNSYPPTISPTVQIVHCTFNVTSLMDETMLDVKGHVDMEGGGNQYVCPQDFDVQKVALKAEMVDKFDYYHVVYWCQSCPEGQYHVPYGHQHHGIQSDHVSHRHRAMACLPCPQHATCKHGQVKPMANYWAKTTRNNQTVEGVEMVLCPPGQCCTEDTCSTGDACPPHQTAPLCSQCITNFTLHIGNNKCIHQDDCQNVLFAILLSSGICFLVLLLCVLVFKLVLVFAWRRGPTKDVFGRQDAMLDRSLNFDEATEGERPAQCEDDDVSLFDEPYPGADVPNQDDQRLVPEPQHGEDKDPKTPTLAKHFLGAFLITMFHCQLLPLVYTSYSLQTSLRYKLGDALVSLYYFRFPFSFLEDFCSIAGLGAAGKVLYQLIQSWMLWIYFVVIFLTLFMLLRCCIKVNWTHSKTFQSACMYFCSLFAMLILIMFIPTTLQYFKLLQCMELDDASVQYIDPSVPCTQWWQVLLWVYLGAFVCPMVLVVALGAALVRHCGISSPHFIVSTFFPLPTLLVWLVAFKPRNLLEKLTLKYNFQNDMLDEVANDNSRLSPGCKAVLVIFHGPYHKLKSQWYHFHWHSVLLFQSLAIIIVSTFLSHEPIVRAFVLTIVLLLCLVIQATVRPFATVLLNRMQIFFLTNLSVMSIHSVFAAIVYSNDIVMKGMNTILFNFCEWAFVVMLGAPVIIFILVSFIIITKHCCCK